MISETGMVVCFVLSCYDGNVSPMANILHSIQVISAIALVALVLLQRSQGDTASSIGSGNASFLQTRRGAERFLFTLTVVVAIVFVATSLAVIVL